MTPNPLWLAISNTACGAQTDMYSESWRAMALRIKKFFQIPTCCEFREFPTWVNFQPKEPKLVTTKNQTIYVCGYTPCVDGDFIVSAHTTKAGAEARLASYLKTMWDFEEDGPIPPDFKTLCSKSEPNVYPFFINEVELTTD